MGLYGDPSTGSNPADGTGPTSGSALATIQPRAAGNRRDRQILRKDDRHGEKSAREALAVKAAKEAFGRLVFRGSLRRLNYGYWDRGLESMVVQPHMP
jgi:hypothetical protein